MINVPDPLQISFPVLTYTEAAPMGVILAKTFTGVGNNPSCPLLG